MRPSIVIIQPGADPAGDVGYAVFASPNAVWALQVRKLQNKRLQACEVT